MQWYIYLRGHTHMKEASTLGPIDLDSTLIGLYNKGWHNKVNLFTLTLLTFNLWPWPQSPHTPPCPVSCQSCAKTCHWPWSCDYDPETVSLWSWPSYRTPMKLNNSPHTPPCQAADCPATCQTGAGTCPWPLPYERDPVTVTPWPWPWDLDPTHLKRRLV